MLLHVTDFNHYLYLAAPSGFRKEDCHPYAMYLERLIGDMSPVVDSVELVERENIMNFQGNKANPYIKITVKDPKWVTRIRSKIEKGETNYKQLWSAYDGGVMTFDSIDYVLRFMIDKGVRKHDLESARD